MRIPALLAGLFVLGLPGCATLENAFGSEAEDQFDTGIAALQRGDYTAANRSLNWVIQRHGDEPIGKKALLVVAALEVDPRNPQRRLTLGSDLAGAYLQKNSEADWSQPVAQALYLLALEMGAAEERISEAEADKRAAERKVETGLPSLPSPTSTISARLRQMTEDRDRLAKKVEQLEAQVADRDKKLEEKEKELERIRKTLKR